MFEPFKLIDDVNERKQKNQETIKQKSNDHILQRTDLTIDNYYGRKPEITRPQNANEKQFDLSRPIKYTFAMSLMDALLYFS